MIGRWLMWLFRTRQDNPQPRMERLRDLEREEREAVRRVVHEGAKAAIEADKATEKADEISRHLGQRGDEGVLTAELALRLLDRRRGE